MNAGAGKKKQSFRKKYKNEIIAYSLIGIPLLWWVVFFVVALIWALFASFTNMRGGYGWAYITRDPLALTTQAAQTIPICRALTLPGTEIGRAHV